MQLKYHMVTIEALAPGKRRKQVKKDKRRSRRKASSTGPEAGYMMRPGKPSGFYDLSHQTAGADRRLLSAAALNLKRMI